jgi:hypothetical protein
VIEQSDVALAAAVLTVLVIGASYLWPRIVCGHPFPGHHRLVRCQLRPFHRGQHVRPWSSPEALGHLLVARHAERQAERCSSGHGHADLGDAIACSLGDDTAARRG